MSIISRATSRPVTRARWAAIGAAVAVTLGAGGGIIQVANATIGTGTRAVFVDVTPTRILDTRANVGLTGASSTGTGRALQVTGTIPTTTGNRTVVPTGATGVVLNVTAVNPSHNGFVSVRPGNPAGTPTTSNLNVVAGVTTPNAVTVAVPTTGPAAGKIQLWYQSANPAATTNLLVDVVGYYTDHHHDDRYYTKAQSDARYYTRTQVDSAITTAVAANAGVKPANVIWVAKSGGQFTTITAALNSITNASATNPYLIKIAPGTYNERVFPKSHVHLEGSGRQATIIEVDAGFDLITGGVVRITQAGNTSLRQLAISIPESAPGGLGVLAHDLMGRVEITDVTIRPQAYSSAGIAQVVQFFEDQQYLRLRDVEILTPSGTALFVLGASPQLRDVNITAGTYAMYALGQAANGLPPVIEGGTIWAGTMEGNETFYLENSNLRVRDSSLFRNSGPLYQLVETSQPTLVNTLIQGSVPTGVTCLNVFTLDATPVSCPT